MLLYLWVFAGGCRFSVDSIAADISSLKQKLKTITNQLAGTGDEFQRQMNSFLEVCYVKIDFVRCLCNLLFIDLLIYINYSHCHIAVCPHGHHTLTVQYNIYDELDSVFYACEIPSRAGIPLC